MRSLCCDLEGLAPILGYPIFMKGLGLGQEG